MDHYKHLMLVIMAIASWWSAVEGTYFEAGNSYEVSPYFQAPPSYSYQTYGYGYRIPASKPKQIPATIPVSPVFEVEVMKAMAQLEEKKTVTLYIVPQNSLHVFPHALQKIPQSVRLPPFLANYKGSLPLTGPLTLSPGHIPAVEVPLQKPLILSVAKQDVLAPAGFTVLLKGPRGTPLTYPLVTGALLAPVPVGTIISPDTPVVLTTLYAVPSLPSLPSAVQILAEFKQPSKGSRPQNQQVVPESPSGPIGTIPFAPVSSGHTFVDYPDSPVPLVPGPIGFGQFPIQDLSTSDLYPVSPQKDNVPSNPPFISLPFNQPTAAPITQVPQSPLPPSFNELPNRPFTNSKESPYLTQLREESLRRQIQDLQQQLNDIQSSRFE